MVANFYCWRGGRPPGFWQSVTGSLEWGEFADAAARREVIEETGITQGVLINLQWTQVYEILPAFGKVYAPGVTPQSRACFFAALAAARAGDAERIGARAISMGFGFGCGEFGVLPHQSRCHRRASTLGAAVNTVVVYVHGLWMVGVEGALLRRRLAKSLSAETYAFTYRSVSSDISENAHALHRFLLSIPADTLHLVGHSLGGLVITRLFDRGDARSLSPGRVVLLGSPLVGCQAAHGLARLPLGRQIMGAGVHEELLTAKVRRWNGARELGVIAGSRSFGLGRLVGVGGAPSDGTILVDETRIDGMAEHLVLPVSHSGLPFSLQVVAAVGRLPAQWSLLRLTIRIVELFELEEQL